MNISSGTRLGHYQIQSEIGAGGMGVLRSEANFDPALEPFAQELRRKIGLPLNP